MNYMAIDMLSLSNYHDILNLNCFIINLVGGCLQSLCIDDSFRNGIAGHI